jgi:SAM-dependent methyltransferase
MKQKNFKQEITDPGQILDMAAGYRQSRIIITAFELDIFSAIGAASLAAADVACKIDAMPKSTERLLNALCALGFLRKEKGLFSNTDASARYLVRGSADYLSGIGHMINLYRSWGTLTQAVRAGTTVTQREYDETSLNYFIEAMHFRAKKTADKLISFIDLSSVKRVLDIGGGSGVYSMAFVRAGRDLSADVFDIPAVTALARRYIEENGFAGRIGTINGDYNTDDFGSGYDLVFMSAIIHINSCDENQHLVKRACAALNPGGRIVIQDHIMEEDRTAPLRGALFTLNMLVNTQSGDTYTEKEMRTWLEKAGCGSVERIVTGMDNDLMVGRT